MLFRSAFGEIGHAVNYFDNPTQQNSYHGAVDPSIGGFTLNFNQHGWAEGDGSLGASKYIDMTDPNAPLAITSNLSPKGSSAVETVTSYYGDVPTVPVNFMQGGINSTDASLEAISGFTLNMIRGTGDLLGRTLQRAGCVPWSAPLPWRPDR